MNLDLQDELRDLKNALNKSEETVENHIKAREKVLG